MIRLINNYFRHIDDRGSLIGLINEGTWEEINLITSKKDIVRGNHYHNYTLELFIILEGEIEVTVQSIEFDSMEKHLVRSGDVFIIEPMINHIFSVKKDSKWINALSRKIEQANPDIHRIKIG
jgi:quercetin dioxygenase-like cupin family protein